MVTISQCCVCQAQPAHAVSHRGGFVSLRSTGVFRRWPKDKLTQLAAIAQSHTYASEAVVVEQVTSASGVLLLATCDLTMALLLVLWLPQGVAPEYFYILRSGICKVHTPTCKHAHSLRRAALVPHTLGDTGTDNIRPHRGPGAASEGSEVRAAALRITMNNVYHKSLRPGGEGGQALTTEK